MTNGYVTAPQCVPSRGGLLSGQYQNRFGLESNPQFEDKEVMGRFARLDTLAERLGKAGYVTGMAGKWHLGPGPEIVDHGFCHVFHKNRNAPGEANIDLEGNDAPFGRETSSLYHLDACSQVASSFITRHRDKPFFFYLAYRAPHVPLDAPRKYLDRFPGKMPERRRQALAMLSAVDDGVGKITATLRTHGLEEHTLIWLIGDNGAPLKIHKLDAPGGGPGWDGSLNDPLNGEKGMLTEGGIRVPFVVQWKGRIPGGQIDHRPVISLDVAATAQALAGLPEDPKLDGVNLLPYLTNEAEGEPHDALYWRWLVQSAIRRGPWKYLRSDEREYLFDLEKDPEEKHDLLAKHPEKVAELKAALGSWCSELSPPGIWAVKSEPMSKQAAAYFDYYLEDKQPGLPPQPGPARPKQPDDRTIFGQRNRNHDDVVTWPEFLGGRTEKVDVIRQNFERRDLDKNGTWEKKEIR